MKVYNVWTMVEVEDTENDTFEDLKDEQTLIGRFNFIENARKYQNDLTTNRPFNEDEKEVE